MANVIFGTIDDDNDPGLFGTEVDDTIYGQAGDDVIVDDEGGNDLLDGGDGNDSVEAGFGDDFVIGGLDDDSVFGEEGNDTLYGGDGFDQLFGGDGNDIIYGEEGDDGDALAGTAGIDGGNGDDLLMGDEGADIIVGGFGSDFISGGDDADILNSHTARVNPRVIEKDEFYLGGGGDLDEVNLFTNYLGGKASTNAKTDGSKAIIFDFKKADGDLLNLLDASSRYSIRSSGNFYGSNKADTVILRGSNTVAVVVDQVLAVGDLGQI